MQIGKHTAERALRGCDGVIALISKYTAKAEGQKWEIQCAHDEGVPTMLMWVNDERPTVNASRQTYKCIELG